MTGSPFPRRDAIPSGMETSEWIRLHTARSLPDDPEVYNRLSTFSRMRLAGKIIAGYAIVTDWYGSFDEPQAGCIETEVATTIYPDLTLLGVTRLGYAATGISQKDQVWPTDKDGIRVWLRGNEQKEGFGYLGQVNFASYAVRDEQNKVMLHHEPSVQFGKDIVVPVTHPQAELLVKCIDAAACMLIGTAVKDDKKLASELLLDAGVVHAAAEARPLPEVA